MHRYGVREVEKLLRLPRSTLRALIQAGFVSPTRGPRRAWLFSFQDLIALRTAQALVAARVSRQRIIRAVRELRRRLPESMPLSGLSIGALAGRVIVKEGGQRWQAESGQYLLGFEGDPAGGSFNVIERMAKRAAPRSASSTWLERALAAEETAPDEALEAYRRAIDEEPALLDAHINRACLLHESGRLAEAEGAYREAIEACGSVALLQYNLGVLLEDRGRKSEALRAYEAALKDDPDFADCHYNLALLCQALRKPRDAIRHMAHYRRLMKGR